MKELGKLCRGELSLVKEKSSPIITSSQQGVLSSSQQEVALFFRALKSAVKEGEFSHWFASMGVHRAGEIEVIFSFLTPFRRDWVKSNYRVVLFKVATVIWPSLRQVDFQVTTKRPVQEDKPTVHCCEKKYQGTFETFVVGEENNVAYSMAKRFVENRQLPFQSLLIRGSVGVGKTHLLQSVRNYIEKVRPSEKVRFLPTEVFVNQFVESLRNKTVGAYKASLCHSDMLLMDDIQFLEKKPQCQKEACYVMDRIIEKGGRIICAQNTGSFEAFHSRLKERLCGGMVCAIADSRPVLREGVLKSMNQKLFQNTLPLAKEVVGFLVSRFKTHRELQGALHRLWVHHQLSNLPLTLQAVEVLFKPVYHKKGALTVKKIQQYCCSMFECSVEEMISRTRVLHVRRARQIAMYLSRRHTTVSLAEIARKFNRGLQATSYSIKKISDLVESDSCLKEQVDEVLRELL